MVMHRIGRQDIIDQIRPEFVVLQQELCLESYSEIVLKLTYLAYQMYALPSDNTLVSGSVVNYRRNVLAQLVL